MIPPRWMWSMHDAEGSVRTEPLSPVFTNQYDAEQWLGLTWRDLAQAGVASVQLLHDGAIAAPVVQLATEPS